MTRKTFFLIFISINCIAYSQSFQWRELPNSPFIPQSTRFEDIYFINAETGWIVVTTGKVFRTTNGGDNWDNLFSSTGGVFRSIGFFDSQNGILGTLHPDSNKVLYRTSNGGANFTAITDLPNPRILGTCGINIVNENVAYGCGRWDTPARIIKTTDRGNSWSSFIIDTSLAGSLVDCYFWDPDSGIAVGGSSPHSGTNAVVLKTNDGGNTWQLVHRTSRSSEYCWKISFVNRNLGFVSIQGSSYYLKTTDGGLTWEDKHFITYIEQGIGFINENTGWIGGWTGPTYETTDAGNSWHPAGWGRLINRFRFLNDTLAYSVGNKVYKYSGESVGIQINSTEIPNKYSLSQNYPNPFNPVTKIKFEIPSNVKGQTSNVKLVVYDALGKEVTTLVNERLDAGSYEAEFNGSNFSSGIYFYKLEAGDFSEVKRMVLLK